MPFTVEDGTGVEGANAYVTIVEAAAYFADRGITWTAATDAIKQEQIVIATGYVDNKYSWPGIRNSRDQGLQWPRTGAFDADGIEIGSDEVPIEVKNAVCEAVLVYSELNTALDRGGMVASVTVGPISETYMGGASPGKVYPKIDSWVRKIKSGSAGRVVVTR